MSNSKPTTIIFSGIILLICFLILIYVEFYEEKITNFEATYTDTVECYTDNIGIWGGDLQTLTDQSLDECREACNVHDECQYWTYAQGPKFLPSRTCVLKTSIVELRQHGSLVSGKSGCDVPEQQETEETEQEEQVEEVAEEEAIAPNSAGISMIPTEDVGTYDMDCEESGVGIWGADVEYHNQVSLEQCVALCDESDVCNYYTYAFQNGPLAAYTCVFKSHVHQRKQNSQSATMISGRSNCQKLTFVGTVEHELIDTEPFDLVLEAYKKIWIAYGDRYFVTLEVSEDGQTYTFADMRTKLVGTLDGLMFTGEVFQDDVGGGKFTLTAQV